MAQSCRGAHPDGPSVAPRLPVVPSQFRKTSVGAGGPEEEAEQPEGEAGGLSGREETTWLPSTQVPATTSPHQRVHGSRASSLRPPLFACGLAVLTQPGPVARIGGCPSSIV